MAIKQSHTHLPKHGSHPLFFSSIHQVLGSRHTQRKHSSYFEGPHSLMLISLFNLYAEYVMQNAGLEEAQAGIKMLGEISITSDMQMTPPLWQKVKRN